jgi:hypothetical protein
LDLKKRTEPGLSRDRSPAVQAPEVRARTLAAVLSLAQGAVARRSGARQSLFAGLARRRSQLEQITPIQTGARVTRWADDGEPFFDVRSPTGTERGLTWQDIIHVALSRLQRRRRQRRHHGRLADPAEQGNRGADARGGALRGAFFANGAQPSMILEYDKKLPNDDVAQRIRAGIERVYSGIDNKWKVAILELGMKMRETSFDPSKTQLTETRKLGAEIACTMYRTPPHKIGASRQRDVLQHRAAVDRLRHRSAVDRRRTSSRPRSRSPA